MIQNLDDERMHREIIINHTPGIILVDQAQPKLADPVTARFVERALPVKIYNFQRVVDGIDITVKEVIPPIHH